MTPTFCAPVWLQGSQHGRPHPDSWQLRVWCEKKPVFRKQVVREPESGKALGIRLSWVLRLLRELVRSCGGARAQNFLQSVATPTDLQTLRVWEGETAFRRCLSSLPAQFSRVFISTVVRFLAKFISGMKGQDYNMKVCRGWGTKEGASQRR